MSSSGSPTSSTAVTAPSNVSSSSPPEPQNPSADQVKQNFIPLSNESITPPSSSDIPANDRISPPAPSSPSSRPFSPLSSSFSLASHLQVLSHRSSVKILLSRSSLSSHLASQKFSLSKVGDGLDLQGARSSVMAETPLGNRNSLVSVPEHQTYEQEEKAADLPLTNDEIVDNNVVRPRVLSFQLDPSAMAALDGLSLSPSHRPSDRANSIATMVEQLELGDTMETSRGRLASIRLGIIPRSSSGSATDRAALLAAQEKETSVKIKKVQFSDELLIFLHSESALSPAAPISILAPELRGRSIYCTPLTDSYAFEQLKRQCSLIQRTNKWSKLALDHVTQHGSILIKYNVKGIPNARFFYIALSDHGDCLQWENVIKQGKGNKPHGISKSLFPSFHLFGKQINPDRSKSLADIINLQYGAFSKRFCRYHQRLDGMKGKMWLGFSIQFTDRFVDLVAENETEVTHWFLALQSLAPQSAFFLTKGGILWQRMIMKINEYGWDPIINNQPVTN
jgi:hypothetical protein